MTRTESVPVRISGRLETKRLGARRGAPSSAPSGPRSVTVLAVSFGVTVVVTRLYLSVTGYPQIGHGEFHLAHALWGGHLLISPQRCSCCGATPGS